MSKASTLIAASDVELLVAQEYGVAADGTPISYKTGGVYVQVLVGSFTTATGSGIVGTLVGIGGFRDADVIVTVTAGAGTAPTMDIYLETRLDGTNWTALAHATQFTGTGTRIIHLSKRQAAGDVQGSGTPGAGTALAIGWADDLRVRRDVSGGTTSPSFSATVYFNGIG